MADISHFADVILHVPDCPGREFGESLVFACDSRSREAAEDFQEVPGEVDGVSLAVEVEEMPDIPPGGVIDENDW